MDHTYALSLSIPISIRIAISIPGLLVRPL
jgi:hypothetical protein